MFFLLYIFCVSGFVFSQSPLSNGNRNVLLCERESANITCDEMSTILISDVQFGPPIYSSGSANDNSFLDKELDIKSRTGIMCNGTQYCYINNTLNEFTTTGRYLPRLTNITYTCGDYAYVGCFQDQKTRLLDEAEIKDQSNMSAKTCYIYCNSQLDTYVYFGTENARECFCGSGQNLDTDTYRKQPKSRCDAPCSGNPHEKCGRHGYISVYKTSKTEGNIVNVEATDIEAAISCPSDAIFIYTISIQKSMVCDLYLANKESSAKSCDEETCSLNEQYKRDFLKDNDMHVIPQYARINFTCIPLDSSTLEADGTDSSTIIVIGACLGVLVICMVILIICLIRRRKARKGKNSESTSNHKSPGAKFTNTEGDEHVSFNRNADMHEDQTYENSPRPPVDDSTDHIYQISAKHKKFESRTDERLNISTHQELRHSTSSDQYADHAEGVYDRANQIQYKTKGGEQAIYSHAVEDVYDSAEVHSRPQPREGDDLYDQFRSQT